MPLYNPPTSSGAVPVKATGAELNTGTDDAKYATAKALVDSDYAKTSDIPAALSKASGAEAITGTDDAKYVTSKTLADALIPRGVKRYVALLTQSGTDAPVATVLENSLGGTVVWSYVTIGEYRGTLNSTFLAAKTVLFSSQNDNGYQFEFVRETDDSVLLRCYRIIIDGADISGELMDGVFTNRSIEIRVYS